MKTELRNTVPVVPHECVEVDLRFRADRPIARELTLSVHADGRAGRILINHRPSVSTQVWPVGHVVEHVLSFVVPNDYPTTDAQLWFGWYDASGIEVMDGDVFRNFGIRNGLTQLHHA